jgi:hypothetical protein
MRIFLRAYVSPESASMIAEYRRSRKTAFFRREEKEAPLWMSGLFQSIVFTAAEHKKNASVPVSWYSSCTAAFLCGVI